jgi:hypothetical protein
LLEFLKASIADLIALMFSTLKNSEGSGDDDSGDSCADPPPPPPNFYKFLRPTLNLQPLSFTSLHFTKNWPKNLSLGQCVENQCKKRLLKHPR